MRKGVSYRIRAAALAAVLLSGANPTASFGAVSLYERLSSYDSYDSWEEADDDTDFGGTQDASRGPGVVMDEDTASQSGPTVKKVTLTERYHDEYKTYEESMADVFFLYTNVGNGGLTDQPVTIDIPANVTYTIEKDGALWEYTAGQAITERGTYVLKLTGVENPELPLSRQTEYQAVFRFRIQEKPPAETSASTPPGTVGVNADGETVLWGNIPEWTTPESLRGGNTASGGAGASAGTAAENSETVSEGAPAETQPGTAAGDISAISAGTSTEPANGQTPAGTTPETAIGETPASVQTPEGTAAENQEAVPADGSQAAAPGGEAVPLVPRTQSYNAARGVYLVTLENGRDLVSSVPEGYIGPGAVEVTVAEEDEANVLLYRNDEPAAYIRGEKLTEPGIYRLVLDGCAYTFTIASRQNWLDLYPAPAGMRLTAAARDGEAFSLASDRYAEMDADGVYSLTMEREDGSRQEVTLVKDTAAPEFTVSLGSGTATIQYLSDDISAIRLYRNGELQEGFSGYTITTPGSYRLTVEDGAGNTSSAEFTLRYRVNAYGIAAVVLVILVIAGGVAFVIHTKKTIRIR